MTPAAPAGPFVRQCRRGPVDFGEDDGYVMATGPTQRSLELLRKEGWTPGVVEKWIPMTRQRCDLFGCIDLVAVRVSVRGVLGVQATSGANAAARVRKIKAEPRAVTWLLAGNRLEVWGWRKAGKRGTLKRWQVRRVELYLVESDPTDVGPWAIASKEAELAEVLR